MTDKNEEQEESLWGKVKSIGQKITNKAKKNYYKFGGYSDKDAKTKVKYGYTEKEIMFRLEHFNYKDNSPKNLKKLDELTKIAGILEPNIQEVAIVKAINKITSKEQAGIFSKNIPDFKDDVDCQIKYGYTPEQLRMNIVEMNYRDHSQSSLTKLEKNLKTLRNAEKSGVKVPSEDIQEWIFIETKEQAKLLIKYGVINELYLEYYKGPLKQDIQNLLKEKAKEDLKKQKGSTEKTNNPATIAGRRFDKAKKAKATAQNDMVAADKTKETATKQTTLTPEIMRQNSGNSLV